MIAKTIDTLKRALLELQIIDYQLNRKCTDCYHYIDITNLSDEESIELFERCSSCSMFYENKFTIKKDK